MNAGSKIIAGLREALSFVRGEPNKVRVYPDIGSCTCGTPLVVAGGIGPVCLNTKCPIVDGPFPEQKEQP